MSFVFEKLLPLLRTLLKEKVSKKKVKLTLVSWLPPSPAPPGANLRGPKLELEVAQHAIVQCVAAMCSRLMFFRASGEAILGSQQHFSELFAIKHFLHPRRGYF